MKKLIIMIAICICMVFIGNTDVSAKGNIGHIYVTDKTDDGHECSSCGGWTNGYKPKSNYYEMGTDVVLCMDNISANKDFEMNIFFRDSSGKTIKSASSGTLSAEYTYHWAYGCREYSKPGQYTAELSVKEKDGTVTTKRVSYYVIDNPISINSIASKTISVGDDVMFLVSATGSNLKYQWYYSKDKSTENAKKISGATDDYCRIYDCNKSAHEGYYYCIVSNYSNKTSYKLISKQSNYAKLTINKRKQTITINKKQIGNRTLALNAKTTGDGKLTYKSSNSKVAKVNSKGVLTFKKKGKVTITITAKATKKYNKATKKLSVKAR